MIFLLLPFHCAICETGVHGLRLLRGSTVEDRCYYNANNGSLVSAANKPPAPT